MSSMADAVRLTGPPLPRQLSSFIGRRAEIVELGRALCESRLLTLTGVAGSGKTRLAIEVALQATPRFSDGVAFVDLGPIPRAAMVSERLAVALGHSTRAAHDPAALVGDARLLLVIDNAEHLVEGLSRLLQELLERCPNLSVLVTSRELLNIAGERCWAVPPLAVPPPSIADLEAIGRTDAVQLLVTRAAERTEGFRLTADNAALVAEICRRLDGIPLALELAAPCVGSLGLAETAARLRDALHLLTRGSRSGPARHRTLRATLDWSYHLLSEQERQVFRRLSVCAGSFALAAVEAICATPDLPGPAVAEVVQRLVDKSLLVPRSRQGGGLRYEQLEVVRQYARERLEAQRETGFRERHARHYAGVARGLDDAEADYRTRLEIANTEYDNLRLALDWASEADTELELGIVESLYTFWTIRGDIREGRERLRCLLAKEGLPRSKLVRLRARASDLARIAGDLEAAQAELELAAGAACGEEDEARLLMMRSILSYETGDCAGAERAVRRAIEILRLLPPGLNLVFALNNLAMIQLVSGRPAEALVETDRALQALRAVPGKVIALPQLMHTRGAALLAIGRVVEARAQFLAALETAAANGSREGACGPLEGLASIAAAEGDHLACLTLLAAVASFARSTGANRDRAHVTPFGEAERRSRAALGAGRSAAAWERGMHMDLEAVCKHAASFGRAAPQANLPPRKTELVRLVAAGLSNKEIARRMSISVRTVESHMDQLRRQLGCRNRAQVAAWAASRPDLI